MWFEKKLAVIEFKGRKPYPAKDLTWLRICTLLHEGDGTAFDWRVCLGDRRDLSGS
jgi:hypothetical protein